MYNCIIIYIYTHICACVMQTYPDTSGLFVWHSVCLGSWVNRVVFVPPHGHQCPRFLWHRLWLYNSGLHCWWSALNCFVFFFRQFSCLKFLVVFLKFIKHSCDTTSPYMYSIYRQVLLLILKILKDPNAWAQAARSQLVPRLLWICLFSTASPRWRGILPLVNLRSAPLPRAKLVFN